jgi:hypothetical protein
VPKAGHLWAAMAKNKSGGIGWWWLSFGVAAMVAVIATSGLPEWSIVVLSIFAGFCFTMSAYKSGWFHAPFVVGVFPRTAVLLCLLWGTVFYVGWRFYPRITIKPEQITFPFKSSTFVFTIKNGTSEDATAVIVKFAYGVPNNDFTFMPSKPESLGDSPVGNVMGITCHTRSGSYASYWAIAHMQPGQTITMQVRSEIPSPVGMSARVYRFSSGQTPYVTTPTAGMVPIEFDEDCVP